MRNNSRLYTVTVVFLLAMSLVSNLLAEQGSVSKPSKKDIFEKSQSLQMPFVANDATGIWDYSSTGNWATGCAADLDRTSHATITQTGNSVTAVDNWTGVTYTGTVSGANYSISATFPEKVCYVLKSIVRKLK